MSNRMADTGPGRPVSSTAMTPGQPLVRATKSGLAPWRTARSISALTCSWVSRSGSPTLAGSTTSGPMATS